MPLTDADIAEYADILVRGWWKNPAVAKHSGAIQSQAKDTLMKLMIENRAAVETSLMRLHDFIHKKNIGAEDYEKAKIF